jgi:small GTP-binding protein domain
MGCVHSTNQNQAELKLKRKDASHSKMLSAKLVLLGDAGVGKSSICQRYIQNTMNSAYEVTIGGAYLQKEITTSNGQLLKLHIWDTGGEERYRAMAPLYYRDSQAALLVYDVTDPRSLQSLDYWIGELDEKVRDDNMIVIIAGNKCDLPNRKVSSEEARKFAASHSVESFEVSAKTGDGLIELFRYISDQLVLNLPKMPQKGQS